MTNFVVSFVHGYRKNFKKFRDIKYPCLASYKNKIITTYSYELLQTPDDFKKKKIKGTKPLKNAKNFKKKNRFGFTGLAQDKNYLYAASFNSIYQINKNDFSVKNIITNQLMSDIHGIDIYDNKIYHILTGLDTIVITKLNGKIEKYFSIDKSLNIKFTKSILKTDWRFVNKMFKGSTGYFHFNYIKVVKKKIWITSRNLNSFIVVDIEKQKAELRTMNLYTTALIHDGLHYKNKIYLTSVNGKLILADQSKKKTQINRFDFKKNIYNRDLIVDIIDLDKKLKKKTNWCRGLDVKKNKICVGINGRYDEKIEFSILIIKKSNLNIEEKFDFNHKKLNLNKKIKLKYITPFSTLFI